MGKMQSTGAEHEEITPAACIYKKTQHFSWKQLKKHTIRRQKRLSGNSPLVLHFPLINLLHKQVMSLEVKTFFSS